MSERKNNEEMRRGRVTKEWKNEMDRKRNWETEEKKKTENLKNRRKLKNEKIMVKKMSRLLEWKVESMSRVQVPVCGV